MLETPILFLIYKRLDTTQKVFQQIRKIRPKYLYIAADGPKTEEESLICQQVRSAVIENIDWDCQVKTLMRSQNLGCGKAVSSAIDWFFENVEEGIIIEDDCFPDLSFFNFCEKLLAYHREEEKIMTISGNNFHKNTSFTNKSYYFSAYAHIWGWATWRRAWQKYNFNMTSLDSFLKQEKLSEVFHREKEWKFWTSCLLQTKAKEIDTWDYQWFYSIWHSQGVSITPNNNLVQNIGFDGKGAHMKPQDMVWAYIDCASIDNIIYNDHIIIQKKADQSFFDSVLDRTFLDKLKSKFYRLWKYFFFKEIE